MPTPPTPATMRPAAMLPALSLQALTIRADHHQGEADGGDQAVAEPAPEHAQRQRDEGAQQHVGADQRAELGVGEVEQGYQVGPSVATV